MRRRRRSSNIELNFDGLTDAVTNLAGTLVLIVVLLIGLTNPQVIPLLGSSGTADRGPESDTTNDLLEQLALLQAQIQRLEAELIAVEDELPAIAAGVDELVERASPRNSL